MRDKLCHSSGWFLRGIRTSDELGKKRVGLAIRSICQYVTAGCYRWSKLAGTCRGGVSVLHLLFDSFHRVKHGERHVRESRYFCAYLKLGMVIGVGCFRCTAM